MSKRNLLKRCVMLCLIVMLGVTSSLSVCWAKKPTLYSTFSDLNVGTNELYEEYYDGSQVVAGCFVAPEEDIYTVTVINTGELYFDTYLYDNNFAEIEHEVVWNAEKQIFDSRRLQKGEKIYLGAERSYYSGTGMLAARVIITKKSGKTVTISKESLSLSKGKTATLKLKNCKDKIIWVSGNKAVATVSDKGVVTAKSSGKATIYAIANDKLYKCVVTVK